MAFKIVNKNNPSVEYVKTTPWNKYDLTFHFSNKGDGKIYKRFANAKKTADFLNKNECEVVVIEV